MNNNPLFINTILLGGSIEEKLNAASQAGFSQVELWRQDVESDNQGNKTLDHLLRQLPLTLTDYQVLLDFDGAPANLRQEKRQQALEMLDTAVQLGTNTLLCCASTHPDCVVENIEQDLRWLVDQAAQRQLRIAYEGMSWSTVIDNTADAWQLVSKINRPNLGLVIDAFHMFVKQRTVADLQNIPTEKIFLVQLSDLKERPTDREHIIHIARHHRLLPGQGTFPLDTLIVWLQENNYQGALGLEVFNDQLKMQDPRRTAQQAMAALQATCRLSAHQSLQH
jgi:4-hydroxyphenylpyruvate dioxygenase